MNDTEKSQKEPNRAFLERNKKSTQPDEHERKEKSNAIFLSIKISGGLILLMHSLCHQRKSSLSHIIYFMLTNRDEENDNSTVEPFEIEGVRDEEVHRLISTPYQNARGPELSDKDASQRNLKVFILSIPVLLFLSIIGSITYINQINVYVNDPIGQYPPELLDNVYKSKDFRNDLHIVPPYWDEMAEGIISNVSVDAIPHMGPCFLPETKPNWTDLIERNRVISSEKDVEYVVSKPQRANGNTKLKLEGLCRPGFIIIGAGKCGTSSLYRYLVGHPRVLPAKNKQIHYFKYFTNYPMQWYLKHFPPAEVFLSNGALMTGEASPGYLVSIFVAFQFIKVQLCF